MPNFTTSLQTLLRNEGGYVNDPDDPGGETYKGIARKMNPKWSGWKIVDEQKKKKNFPKNLATNKQLTANIVVFYRLNYWDKINGDLIGDPDVAFSIFDFAVNAGVVTSAKLAQKVAGVKQDGVIGKMSIAALNKMQSELFLAKFTLEKITRYIKIVEAKPTSKKFFYGWIRRALNQH